MEYIYVLLSFLCHSQNSAFYLTLEGWNILELLIVIVSEAWADPTLENWTRRVTGDGPNYGTYDPQERIVVSTLELGHGMRESRYCSLKMKENNSGLTLYFSISSLAIHTCIQTKSVIAVQASTKYNRLAHCMITTAKHPVQLLTEELRWKRIRRSCSSWRALTASHRVVEPRAHVYME
jgi:hypothetical protein